MDTGISDSESSKKLNRKETDSKVSTSESDFSVFDDKSNNNFYEVQSLDSASSDSNSIEKVSNFDANHENSKENLEDPIVARHPVYLNSKLTKYLNLFQYTTKNSDWEFKQDQLPSSARIKPVSGVIEFDTPIDTSSSMYSQTKGTALSAGMPANSIANSNRLFDTQTWTSTPVKKKASYTIGVFIDGELHLTPINKISQFRYNLDYIDKISQKKSDSEKKELENVEPQDKPVPKAKAVQVKVRSVQAEEALMKQENSISKIRQKIEDEQWSNLEYFGFEASWILYALFYTG
ncbi:hypothetical protein BB560_007033 [Smittium megazygosporum]|uniref:Uncharacterized protein n=1 Tax=Smittium megazygosporum TaxID=133381 RepID=A0A2T9XZ93_9FUNG|nr:hypothetical protein BB560_007033 [Smittium megazygosporum]